MSPFPYMSQTEASREYCELLIAVITHHCNNLHLPFYFRQMLLGADTRIEVIEGAKHNLPDVNAQKAAKQIHELANSLTKSDLLLVLISGTHYEFDGNVKCLFGML